MKMYNPNVLFCKYFLPDGSILKQTLERLYVACGLKEFLADVTEETLKELHDADLEIKNGFCHECLVKVDIVGVDRPPRQGTANM